MTIEEAGKYLWEKMGKCWHERGEIRDTCLNYDTLYLYLCPKCKDEVWWNLYGTKFIGNPNVSSWQFFGEVWEWARGQEWWSFFAERAYKCHITDLDLIGSRFIVDLAEWLKDKESAK